MYVGGEGNAQGRRTRQGDVAIAVEIENPKGFGGSGSSTYRMFGESLLPFIDEAIEWGERSHRRLAGVLDAADRGTSTSEL